MRRPFQPSRSIRTGLALVGALACALPAARAAAAEGEGAVAKADKNKVLGWLTAVTPRKHMFEVGAFGGLFLPSRALELHFRNVPFRRYESVGAELGLRLGYFPLRHFGFEGELAMMPTHLETEQRAFVSSARAHLVLQLGLARLVPFAVVGGGVLSVRSEDDAAGDDADQAFSVGGGAKLFLNRHIVLRLDVRDVMSPKRGIRVDDPADSVEVLLGFSLALGPRERSKKKAGPPDTDGDGVIDESDQCPHQAARTPDGCARIDTDDDGFDDKTDRCPKEAGAAPDGCPIADTDEDGFLDPDDACPQEAGVAPDGCAAKDADGDGIEVPADRCPNEAENDNAWESDDGCPDQLPADLQGVVGDLGVAFDRRNRLDTTSRAKLDDVAAVLASHPHVRVEIEIHEALAANGRARADAVTKHLVAAGLDASRFSVKSPTEDAPGTSPRVELRLTPNTDATPPPSQPATDGG